MLTGLKVTMENKKVLHISVRSDSGGGPKHLYDLIKNTKTSLPYTAAPIDPPYHSKIKTYSLKKIDIPHRKFSLLSFFTILNFCRVNSINIVHSHGRGAGIYSRLLKLFGFNIIHTFHGVHQPKDFKEKIYLKIEQTLSLLTDHFIFVSVSEKRAAISLKLTRTINCSIIQNGIDLKLFKDMKKGPARTFGTISRLDPHKNNVELIEFMRGLPSYQLYIAGDGEEYESLSKICPKNVHLMGEVTNIYHFLEKFSIYVSASKGEGLPYSILEALAANKQILASRVSGHIDILKDENLYELGNFENFCSKLQSLPEPDYNIENFTIEQMVTQVEKLYQKLS